MEGYGKISMESYVEKDNKRLRRGFTTGTCAAAAACGAAQMLLSKGKEQPEEMRILTPKGIEVRIQAEESRLEESRAFCTVRKDSGDDPDVTNGTQVCASVERIEDRMGEILIDGGKGVGRVTKPGLACRVGEAAINPVPRSMIRQQVQKVAERYGYEGGLKVIISIPQGEELARKTFNPKLGIVGGISVLGTSGIVEPMSEQALVDTIKVELRVARAAGTEYLVLTPGNYGERFLQETKAVSSVTYVKCSNFIGDALDYVKELGFKGVLLVGHIGKLVKVAAGAMNTHSRYGDGRMETLARHLQLLGGDPKPLMDCITTEDAIAVIKRQEPELEEGLWTSILEQIQRNMERRLSGSVRAEAMIYSNQYGYLGETPDTGEFLIRAKERKEQEQ